MYNIGDRVIWIPTNMRNISYKFCILHFYASIIRLDVVDSSYLAKIVLLADGLALEERWVSVEELIIDKQYYRELKINKILDV